MPNYCENKVRVIAPDEEAAKRFVDATKESKLFSEFLPLPEGLDGEKQYWWCVNNWGTKWEMTDDAWPEQNGLEIEVEFYTAWAPPIGVYNELVNVGFEVLAYYNEPGVGFCGKFENGNDECIRYPDENLKDAIPSDIYEMFDFSDYDSDEENEDENG